MAYVKNLFDSNFIQYASYVIRDRAIPEITDGLKPVQRRIIHTLIKTDDGRFTKVANVCGKVMAYHPHGDASIYTALVNLANKELFIDKQGNFGNMYTGDGASAPRYIECRLKPITKDILNTNPKITQYVDTYDSRDTEPLAFQAKLPLVLIMGAEGIAVGMSTYILSHNIHEVIEAERKCLRGEKFHLYPDFPTGGLIDVSGYEDGLGKIVTRAKMDTSDDKKIVITELPYGSTTESLCDSIEKAVKAGKIKATSIQDYTSDKVNIEVRLQRGVYTKDVVDALYAFTDCEQTIYCNLLVIKDNMPVQMTCTQVIQYHSKQLVGILKQELELEKAELTDKLHLRTLERIFVEERIYKKIESQKTEEGVLKAVKTGFVPFKAELIRAITDEDVDHLLKIPIRRISLYDMNKNKQEVEAINARIKEELEAGRSASEAIKYGFKRSTSAILDGNITTLIVAIVLLIFGSGSVQGFGMTLAIGIVLSVITSLLVSRLIVECLYGMGLKDSKFYARVSGKKKKVFDYVGKKVIWFVIAAVLIVAGAVTMVVNGATGKNALNYNIEFVGGVSTQVDFQKEYSIDEFNDEIKGEIAKIIDFNNEIKGAIADVIGSTDIEGQKVTGTTQYVIKTPDIEADVRQELQDMLVDKYGAAEDSFETTYISSTVSSELQRDAYISLAIAAACMLLYIWIRFRKFKFAISSVIALIHDVFIVVTFFAIFRLSVGNSFIACILTIVGYSINATIVIFDRIRENMQNNDMNYDLKNVVNTSIQQTLTRSIYTSATTFVMVLFLYILGVESMRAFAMPLAVGIVAGAFSSIFISGCLYFIMTKKSERLDETRAAKAAKAITQTAVDGSEVVVDGASEVGVIVEELPKKITANPNRKKNKKRKQ